MNSQAPTNEEYEAGRRLKNRQQRHFMRLPGHPGSPSFLIAVLTGFLLASVTSRLTGQVDTAHWVLIAPNPDYDAGTVHRFIFGGDYRDLWTTPTKVVILNLQTFAGGLRPVKVGGGQQTHSLRLVNPDGREYSFRSVDKDPSAILPPDLRGTLADDLLQDQISSAYPAGPLVVSRLLDAAGVLHAVPQIYVMPDDPALGEFRAAFRNMLGTIEEHPAEGKTQLTGLENASRIIDMDKLLEHLEESPGNHIDTLGFLKARMMDLLVGDWDRHRGQWSWARIGPDEPATAWSPIPKDRDQAFVRYDGMLLAIGRETRPQLVNFGPKYPSIYGATFNGRELDRQLLSALDRAAFDSIAHDLQRSLTDAVIDSAVNALPVQQFRIDGRRLASTLRVRRDKLPAVAEKYFRYLASETDLQGTDHADRVTITRGAGIGRAANDVEVLMESSDSIDGAPATIRTAHRVFRPRDTNEIRFYLHGGDDSVLVRGGGNGDITIRIVGGKGEDVVIDSSDAGNIRMYDTGDHTVLQSLHGGDLDRSTYTRPDTTTPVPPRDWGTFWQPTLWGTGSADLGVFLGAGFIKTDFGFRKDPFAGRHSFRAGYATAARTFRAEYVGEWHVENSRTYTNLLARGSGIEILRFFGFGNETANNQENDFYKVRQEQYLLEPSITIPLSRFLSFSGGPRVQYNRLEKNEGRFISTLPSLYGAGNFGQIGARGSVHIDTRDVIAAAQSGILLNIEGLLYPGLWDVKATFGKVRGDIATYLTAPIPSSPTLALRIGGERVFGRFPFHEAAYLGGRNNLLGWQEQRFAGDASAYGNAELRIHIGRIPLVVPTALGIFGLADIGRVYSTGETSDEWHTGFGGGVSLGFLTRKNTVTFTVARSDEITSLYIRAGFMY
ncbi:MAG: BamA/TamA family outer membrane protein [Gemmatimonadota bacterium]